MHRQKTSSQALPASTSVAVAAGLLLLVGSFQAALAAGAPWGVAAYGGATPGRLPSRLRASSAASTILYALLAILTLRARPGAARTRRVLTAATALMALGTVMNLASRSRVERALWTPVAGMLTVALARVVRELRN
ncbi:hypothetical protein PTW37_07070 [Arthrobacter agilis]|uniref:hypothetical protein n=1 Tax=Arthrobacter agilis TaxID=37921 RepID=UPI0023669E04|nr:hypothetical protein [Arthrobacter agilis]WDF34648.1 hypothetical protein PTW37_07070 [Arthrobacter agilis]